LTPVSAALAIGADMIEAKIKKGWEELKF